MNCSHLIDTLEPRRMLASLASGVTWPTVLSARSSQKNWTIELVAGQNLTLAAGDVDSGAIQTELILIAPNNKALRRSVGENGSFISYNAPVSGTYRVRVRDVGRNDFGNVQVTAFYYQPSITDSDDAFVAESGRRRPATIEPGDLDVWTLTSAQGQFLSVHAAENTTGSSVDIGMLIIGPDGKVVTGGENERGVKLDIPNARSGNYYAVVYEAAADDSGRYGITFGRVPGEQYSGDPDTNTPLQNGVTRTGDMPAGDYDIWGINLSSGNSFSATLSRSGGSLNPELLLIDPTGQLVKSTNGNTSTTLTYSITTSGTWWLLGRDRDANSGGAFTILYSAS